MVLFNVSIGGAAGFYGLDPKKVLFFGVLF